MIKSFKDGETEELFEGHRVRRWQSIEAIARRKLVMLNAANELDDLRVPPGNRLHRSRATAKANTQFALTINSGFVLFGGKETHMKWKSRITTRHE